MPNDRFLTTEAFGLYVAEESNFRARLEARLAEDHRVLRGELSEIKAYVRDTNGRVNTAEQVIAVIRNELRAIKDEDIAIDTAVQGIQRDGCGKYHAHVDILRYGGDPAVAAINGAGFMGWSRPKKVGAAVGATLLAWPALQEIAKAVHALVEWLGSR